MAAQINQYFIKFKNAIMILVVSVIVSILLITKIVPLAQSLFETQSQIKSQSTALADKERNLADLQETAKKQSEKQDYEKAFYKPVDSGLDTEAVMAFEFNEILQLIRANSVKMRSIKYDYNPADDNFVKGAGAKFDASRLDIEMISDYKDFEGFLKDLYKHEHFLDIVKIEIAPYQKDKKILLINFQMKLYAEKNGAAAASNAKSASEPSPFDAPADSRTGISPDGGLPQSLQ